MLLSLFNTKLKRFTWVWFLTLMILMYNMIQQFLFAFDLYQANDVEKLILFSSSFEFELALIGRVVKNYLDYGISFYSAALTFNWHDYLFVVLSVVLFFIKPFSRKTIRYHVINLCWVSLIYTVSIIMLILALMATTTAMAFKAISTMAILLMVLSILLILFICYELYQYILFDFDNDI